MGIWFGLATALCWSIGIFPFTEASKALGANTVNTVRLLLASIALGLITIFFHGLTPSELIGIPGAQSWLWLSLSGLLGLSLGDYFSFRAFARLGARNSSVFSTLAPGAALLVAFLLRGSMPRLFEIAGMLVTLGGVYLLLFLQNRDTPAERMDKRGITDAVMAALCQGAGLVFSEIGMEASVELEPVHAAFMRMFSGCIVLYVIAFTTGRLGMLHKSVYRGGSKAGSMLLAGTLFGPVLGNTLAMLAVKHLAAPVAQTIFSLVPIMAIPLSAIFNKEKISLNMVWPALIAFLGVVILVIS